MTFEIPIMDIVFSACTFLFPFWPLLVIVPIRGKNNLVAKMLVMWAVMGIVRLVLVFSPLPTVDFLIPEPWNTILFISVGIVLVVGRVVEKVKR